MAQLRIKFAEVDPTAKADIGGITLSPSSILTEINDLKYDNVPLPENYATCEHNYTILDGRMTEIPDAIDRVGKTFGVWANMSGADGMISSVSRLTINFNLPHKSNGLTLYFYPHTNDYAKTVHITWRSGITATAPILKEDTYTLDAIVGVVNETVEGYRRIEIDFLSTNIPYRFVKVFAVDFGIVRTIEDEEINSCDILEEIDPTVESLSVNTMNANIRTRNSIFSPITSIEPDSMMMRRQLLTVTRDNMPFGTFFLENWEDVYQTGVEFNISAGDGMSILDFHRFVGGIYTNKKVKDLLDEIFAIAFPTGLLKYILDPVFENAIVSGWLPICSCGEALQHICFAINATADTARIGDVWIYPREQDIKSDGTPASTDIQPFINPHDIISYLPPFYYATLEPNYTTLDGVLNELPNDPAGYNLGWCSASMSDGAGRFSIPPTLDIAFSTSHNLSDMIFGFGAYENEYMKSMRITFYDERSTVLSSEVYTFSSNHQSVSNNIAGYRRIKIEVLETSAPFRYAKIATIDYGKSFNIPLEKQYRRGKDTPTEYISGVDVISHSYSRGNEEIEVQRGVLPLGQNTIEFSEPLHTLSLIGGTILSSNANYAVINVTTTGDVILTGRKYINNHRVHSVRAQAISQFEMIKRYENYTLVSPADAQNIANEIFAFLQSRICIETDVVLDDLEVGYIANVKTRGRDVVGVITSLDSNLRANISTMEVIGDVDNADI